jgi:hypothetical protein
VIVAACRRARLGGPAFTPALRRCFAGGRPVVLAVALRRWWPRRGCGRRCGGVGFAFAFTSACA